MVTGTAPESYRALFPLCSLKKNNNLKLNKIKNHAEE